MAKRESIERGEPTEIVIKRLGVDVSLGLDEREAKRRLRRDGENRIFEEKRSSVLRYAGYCSSDLLLVLLLLTSVTAAAFGIKTAYRVLLPILILSIVMRTAAYITARRRLEALSSEQTVMPSSAVVRDGKVTRVDARTIVRGDVIKLAPGDIVPADCRIYSAAGLEVYEESVTGVTGNVRKSASDDITKSPVSRSDTVYAGSVVLSGSATAVVIETGADTLAVRTKGYFKSTRGGVLKLSRLLEKYSRVWGAVMTVVAFAVTVVDIFWGRRELYDVFFMGLSLAVASMCEYYSALGDIAAAMGLFALGNREGVAVRGVKSIETLSELDVIITGADGVVTSDGMESQGWFFDGKVGDGDVPPELLRHAAMVTRAGDESKDKNKDRLTGECVSSLYEYIELTDVGAVYDEGEVPVLVGGIADGLRFDTRLLDIGGIYMSVSGGDAGAVLDACSYVYANGADATMSQSARDGIAKMIAHHERRGATSVAIARKRTPFHSMDKLPFAQADMTLYGIIFLYRPLSKDLVKTVAACRDAGIRIVMTGKGVESAKLADRAWIISGREDIVTGREFASMNGGDAARCALNARLLVGFDTRQLLKFTSILRESGKKAAYAATLERDMKDEMALLTSVGAGFALSSENANSEGVVRGISQAIKMRADNIIPRAGTGKDGGGGLSAIAASVAYSKRIYRNISNIAAYLLTSQAARIFSVLYTALFHKSALVAEQILLWGLIFDFFAVLVLARERPDARSLSDVHDVYERLSHPLSNLGLPLSYGLFWAALTMLAPHAYASGFDVYGASVIFVSVLLSMIVVCGEHREEYPAFSKKRSFSMPSFVFACAVAATILAITVVPSFASALELTQPDPYALLVSLIPPAALLALYELPRIIHRNKHSKEDT